MDTFEGVSSMRKYIFSKFVSGFWFMNFFPIVLRMPILGKTLLK